MEGGERVRGVGPIVEDEVDGVVEGVGEGDRDGERAAAVGGFLEGEDEVDGLGLGLGFSGLSIVIGVDPFEVSTS